MEIESRVLPILEEGAVFGLCSRFAGGDQFCCKSPQNRDMQPFLQNPLSELSTRPAPPAGPENRWSHVVSRAGKTCLRCRQCLPTERLNRPAACARTLIFPCLPITELFAPARRPGHRSHLPLCQGLWWRPFRVLASHASISPRLNRTIPLRLEYGIFRALTQFLTVPTATDRYSATSP